MAWRLLKACERNRSNLHDHETTPLDREARSRHGPAALTQKDMMPNEFHLIRGRALPADITRPVIMAWVIGMNFGDPVVPED